MEKEKIIVARNCEPEGSPSEYLGAEVSIGLLTAEKITELKLMLQNDKLFEEMAGKWDETYIGSTYLTDLMDVNEVYHKNGLIYYEDLSDNGGDVYSYSTDNWAFVPAENENWEPNPDFKSPQKVEIEKEGLIVISIRTMDLYFKAQGEFSEEHKIIFDNTEVAKFKVQTGIDNFHSMMTSSNFCGFNLLHSTYVNGEELIRDEDAEGEADNIYYSSHLILKDGKVIAWLASNNNSHTFPFDYNDTEIPCISPHFKECDPEAYQVAVKSLIKII
jgi:hypothetical protein